MEGGGEEDVRMAGNRPPLDARYVERAVELLRRLLAEYGVAGVTFASSVPGDEYPTRIEVEDGSTARGQNDAVRSGTIVLPVRFGAVDPRFFDVFGVSLLAGRHFTSADAGPSGTGILVNQSFARRFFGDANVLGRRIREVGWDPAGQDRERPWLEIVGIVPDFPSTATDPDSRKEAVYRAISLDDIYPVRLAVHVRGASTADAAARFRRVAAALDPKLQLHDVRTIDAVIDQEQRFYRVAGPAIAVVASSVLLLSAAGIHAMMSLAVARRRREIGIRAALGARPRRLLASVFARASVQLGMGAGVGLIAALILDRAMRDEPMIHQGPILVPIVAVIMIAVGLLASIGPARRGLRIQPTEALRQER
jgi:hypothetical protein